MNQMLDFMVDPLRALAARDTTKKVTGRKGTTKKRIPARARTDRSQSSTANVARKASSPE